MHSVLRRTIGSPQNPAVTGRCATQSFLVDVPTYIDPGGIALPALCAGVRTVGSVGAL